MTLSPRQRIRERLALWFGFRRRAEMESRMKDESTFHIEMATEKNIRAGMQPDAARSAAMAEFGARGRWDAESRDEYRSRLLEELGQDVRYAWRSLRSSPSFTFAAVATLALSIGATTAMFSVVNTVLLRALPYPDPTNIAVLCERNMTRSDPSQCNVLNPGNFLTWRETAKSFSEAGAFRDGRVAVTGRGSEPVSASVRFANASVLSILGARASVGRLFTQSDDTVGTPNVVVLTDGLWRRHFGGDSSIVGQQIQMNGFDYTVIGVAAADLRLYETVEMWLPARFNPSLRNAPGRSIRAIARLKPGVTIEAAAAEMAALADARARDVPDINKHWTAFAMPLRESLVGSAQRSLWVLLGAVGFLLVIACTNVANLLLARAATREREVAVRISLGASPWRIVRQLLTESVVLSLISAAIGLVIAIKGTQALIALVPAGISTQSMADVSPDWRVMVFAAVVAIGTGVFFGIAPALNAARANLQTTLKEGGRGGSGASRSTARVRNALVVAEMSLALMLLAGAGLMVRSLAALQHVQLGFEAEHALTTRIALPARKYGNDTLRQAFFRDAEARVAALPGVTAVGAISYLPLSGDRSASGFNVEGQPFAERGTEPTGDMRAVTPGYFKAMDIAVKEGRGLTDQDLASTQAVGLVSETLAKKFWPNESAVGHYLLYTWNGDERVQIVGVAADVHHQGVDKAPVMEIYRPLTQFPYSAMTMVVRTAGDPSAMVAPLRAAMREIDRDLPLAQLRPMRELVGDSMGKTRLSAVLFALFGFIGLVLAAVGIYGVMSYTVEQRQREIGIRMALGAGANRVLANVVQRGAILTIIGIAIGTVGGVLTTRLMSTLLFGVTPGDVSTFVVTAATLGIVALVATYIPGRRATRVDPIAVLRGD